MSEELKSPKATPIRSNFVIENIFINVMVRNKIKVTEKAPKKENKGNPIKAILKKIPMATIRDAPAEIPNV